MPDTNQQPPKPEDLVLQDDDAQTTLLTPLVFDREQDPRGSEVLARTIGARVQGSLRSTADTWRSVHEILPGGGESPHPVDHLDMFVTLAGRGPSGRYRILVGSPALADDLLGRASADPALSGQFDEVAAQLVRVHPTLRRVALHRRRAGPPRRQPRVLPSPPPGPRRNRGSA